MKIDTIKVENLYDARKKWLQYCAATKVKTGYYKEKHPLYRDLKKVYYALKSGKLIISIKHAITQGGVHRGPGLTYEHPNWSRPKLAIASAHAQTVRCLVSPNGQLSFRGNGKGINWNQKRSIINLPAGTIPGFQWQDGNQWRTLEAEAPVPLIPPQHAPKVMDDDYYILWEVDLWKKVAPVDPWLLRRITDDHFVVVASWDLTTLEREVMNSYL